MPGLFFAARLELERLSIGGFRASAIRRPAPTITFLPPHGAVIALTLSGIFEMRVRMTRTWRFGNPSLVQLDAGQVFEIRPSLAIYLFAMHCAELDKPSVDSERKPSRGPAPAPGATRVDHRRERS